MSANYYNASLRNLTYRLRVFKDSLPLYLEEAIREKEGAIVKAISQKQLYNRGINGRGVKIKSYRPYTPYTIKIKQQKHQPHTRVTLRDTGAFYAGMRVVYDSEGFYVTSDDLKTEGLVAKYGPEIFRLTDQNLTDILRKHIKVILQRKVREAVAQAKRVAKFKAKYERDKARQAKQAERWRAKGKTYL